MGDELELLTAAVQGLLYPSESDEPFQVRRWAGGKDPLGAEDVKSLLGKPVDVEVKEQALAEFFDELVSSPEGAKFQVLREVLERALRDVRVFRVGSVRVDVLILGRDRAGDWVGLHTISVET